MYYSRHRTITDSTTPDSGYRNYKHNGRLVAVKSHDSNTSTLNIMPALESRQRHGSPLAILTQLLIHHAVAFILH